MQYYVLVVLQDANFQSRTGLFPAAELLAARGQEWQQLKADCVDEILDGIATPNVLWQDIVWQDGVGSPVRKVWSKLVGDLAAYLEWGEEVDLGECRSALCNLCTGFDHVKNFHKLRQLTSWQGQPLTITDSVLMLERRQGGYAAPPFETVQELIDSFDENKENT